MERLFFRIAEVGVDPLSFPRPAIKEENNDDKLSRPCPSFSSPSRRSASASLSLGVSWEVKGRRCRRQVLESISCGCGVEKEEGVFIRLATGMASSALASFGFRDNINLLLDGGTAEGSAAALRSKDMEDEREGVADRRGVMEGMVVRLGCVPPPLLLPLRWVLVVVRRVLCALGEINGGSKERSVADKVEESEVTLTAIGSGRLAVSRDADGGGGGNPAVLGTPVRVVVVVVDVEVIERDPDKGVVGRGRRGPLGGEAEASASKDPSRAGDLRSAAPLFSTSSPFSSPPPPPEAIVMPSSRRGALPSPMPGVYRLHS